MIKSTPRGFVVYFCNDCRENNNSLAYFHPDKHYEMYLNRIGYVLPKK